MTRKKIIIPVRAGMPVSCIECHGVIHRKSEHYCSKQCENVYEAPTDMKKPPFRSKWKERKLKEAKDPLIRERKKVRMKKNDLIILVPSFITSQLKGAFEIGVLIYLPFFVIDLVTSNILLAMGMMMLSPLTIALPIKLLLLVMIDGWTILVQGLILTFK